MMPLFVYVYVKETHLDILVFVLFCFHVSSFLFVCLWFICIVSMCVYPCIILYPKAE